MTTSKKLLPLALLALVFLVGSCIVVGPRNKRRRARRGCHPSHYWNGHRCVHKGKAKGHRKHKGKDHRKHKKHKRDHRDY